MIHIGTTGKLNGIPTFSIPANETVCGPYHTRYCDTYCYAKIGRFHMNGMKNNLMDNFRETLDAFTEDTFAERMSSTLARTSFPKYSPEKKLFRIHASGEFYDMHYFNKWRKIAEINPHIYFMAYTKNREAAQYEDKPKNLKLFYSIDPTTPYVELDEFLTSVAMILPAEFHKLHHLQIATVQYYRPGIHPTERIPTFKAKVRVCTKSDCVNCGFCWLPVGLTWNVAFPARHSLKNRFLENTIMKMVDVKLK